MSGPLLLLNGCVFTGRADEPWARAVLIEAFTQLSRRITDLTAMTPAQKAAHDRWVVAADAALSQADTALHRLELAADEATP